jgi:hypothetical protein
MVTEDKTSSGALARYHLGSVLIWLGVTVWLPFIGLRLVGEKPSLFWYLPFHLLGVIGGSRLRASARRELGQSSPKKNRLQMIGHGAIFAGILVWAPYFLLEGYRAARGSNELFTVSLDRRVGWSGYSCCEPLYYSR